MFVERSLGHLRSGVVEQGKLTGLSLQELKEKRQHMYEAISSKNKKINSSMSL